MFGQMQFVDVRVSELYVATAISLYWLQMSLG